MRHSGFRLRHLSLALIATVTFGGATPLLAQTWGQIGVNVYTLPGEFAFSGNFAVNDAGQVAGFVFGDLKANNAVVYDPIHGVYTTNLAGVFPESRGYVVDNAGRLIGDKHDENGIFHAFLYDGTAQDLGTLGGSSSSAYGASDLGHVTGQSETAALDLHAFLYADGTMQDLGTLGGAESLGFAVNDLGQVAGRSDNAVGGQSAFLYSGGVMQDLGSLGTCADPTGIVRQAYAINNAGLVTGDADVDCGTSFYHAFLYDGTMRDLGTLPGDMNSTGWGIDGSGRVVGMSNFDDGVDFYQSATIWESDTNGDYNPFNIDDIVAQYGPPGWIFDQATAISRNGKYIVAEGYNDLTGAGGYVVLENAPYTPTPEPASLALLATGLVALVGMGRRRRHTA